MLLPPENGKPREYVWNVEKHAGRRVRIALIDSDARAGCHVVCSGFKIVTRDEINGREFAEVVRQLESKHKLRRLSRYTSTHFMAYSNANEADTEYRLYNCETIHAVFFKHFRKRGFDAAEPVEKMMVALFDTQTGFEAYLGQQLGSAVTGVYHTPTNRLVVYDYGTNSAFMAGASASRRKRRAPPAATSTARTASFVRADLSANIATTRTSAPSCTRWRINCRSTAVC